MKKKRILSPENLGVAERLRAARERLNLSQAEVAQQLGITRESLASYEDGRAPVRFDFALKFCWQMVFSEEWLALGETEIINRLDQKHPGHKHVWYSSLARRSASLLFNPIVPTIKRGTPFYEAFNEHLAIIFKETVGGDIHPRILISGPVNDALLKNYFHALMECWMQFHETPFVKFRFLRSLAASAERINTELSMDPITSEERETIIYLHGLSGQLPDNIESDSKEMEDYLKKAGPEYLAMLASGIGGRVSGIEKKPVDNVPKLGNIEGVKAKFPGLLDRLKKATEQRGKKAALAKFLDVPLSKVSQWLSSTYEPGGETTLQLLNWVEQEERQK